MRSVVRALTALLVAAAAASYGLVVVDPAAAAASPAGGCWAYRPALDPAPASDISTALEPWTTVADGGFLLESDGATAVGRTRTATATIASGPVISSTDDVTGTASFLFSLDGQPLAEPVEVSFDVEAGDPVEDLVAEAAIPIAAAGAHTVGLEGVSFDVPAESLRVACNGQETGTPGGTNPATVPEPTDLTTDFAAVAASSATITSVADQAVLDTARPGDVVTVALAGLASSAPASLRLCGPSATGATGATCLTVGDVVTEPDGTATATLTVPGTAPVGAGTLRAGDGVTEVSTPFAVLGVQLVAAAEKLGVDSTTVTLTGTGWDPTRPVAIRGYAGTSSSTAATADPTVTVAVTAAGGFTADFEVADKATKSVIVDQARTSSHIGAVYLISGVIGGAGAPVEEPPVDEGEDPDANDPTPDAGDETTDSGGTSTDAGTGTDTAVVPPVEIPLPEDVPVVVPTPVAPTPDATEDLAVSEVRLDGQATLSELFGGSPRRDLIFLVENVGAQTVTDPVVRVAVGRSDDVEPQLVDAEVGDLDPGEQSVVTVPLELPMAAFGGYRVVGQVGDTDDGAFALKWSTYPWGLFALNAVALGLLGWGVQRRLGLRRTPAAALDVPENGEAVVDLAAADAWWAYRNGTGPRPVPDATVAVASAGVATEVLSTEPPAPVDSGDAVVDLDAAESWWERSGAKSSRNAS
ncbi:hypothetical protein [Nocardioides sp. W7]|uniref:hypothetical protein n=1 Tax=Nocardioides sp. W7 TaxID=2931390 RepID=UPI001FD462DC|nr:hypothetical protein [Nocardioides sp. W7]